MKAIAKLLNPFQETKGPQGVTITHNSLEGPKLFAVTEDVKIGDEVWDLFKGIKHGIAEKVHEVYIELKDVSYDIDRTNGGAVKILGPLSPNAIWVKDGDEIKIADSWGQMESEEQRMDFIKLTGPITVLGPCGHYH